MVQLRNLLKRCMPLILTLVLVISLFPAVAASAADYTLSGYWLFDVNFSTSNTYDISQDILFTSNGQAFSSITYVKDQTTGTPSLQFCAIKYNSVQVKNLAWVDDAYRYVDFGSTPQTVSASFYNWFTSHATQQARPETSYYVSIDGSSFQYPSTADSITLDLIITANDYKLSVDGSEEDYRISDTVLNNDRQQFAGLSVEGVVDQVDYGIGRHEIILTPSDPPLFLGTVWKYPLYIDPNGGTWNGSSSVSVFWELANTDTDEIYDPVRPGYTFDGWTFTGDGEFNDVGDPPYIYEHGTAPGYLTANWIADSPDPEPDPEPDPGTGNTYTTTITLAGRTLTFTGTGASPDITVTDTGYSVQFTDGVSTKSVSYDILGVTAASFGGLSFTENGSPFLSPGGSYVIGGLSGTDFTTELYPISQVGPFETIVVVGGKIYEFVSNEAYPVVTISISADKLVLSDGVTTYEWRPAAGVVFLGVSLEPNGSEPDYRVSDEGWIVQGSADKDIFQYYPFYVGSADPQYTDAQRVFVGMANFLIGPLMIFFSVEFIPGLSFGGICLLAFCVGLIFWLLKASK